MPGAVLSFNSLTTRVAVEGPFTTDDECYALWLRTVVRNAVRYATTQDTIINTELDALDSLHGVQQLAYTPIGGESATVTMYRQYLRNWWPPGWHEVFKAGLTIDACLYFNLEFEYFPALQTFDRMWDMQHELVADIFGYVRLMGGSAAWSTTEFPRNYEWRREELPARGSSMI